MATLDPEGMVGPCGLEMKLALPISVARWRPLGCVHPCACLSPINGLSRFRFRLLLWRTYPGRVALFRTAAPRP
jgi:hypothetical protein